MDLDWAHELTEQLGWYWDTMFRPRLAGLTDAEYCWEPVPNCWSLRPQQDGHVTLDIERPEPSPPPVTTIAWRMCHLLLVLRHRVDPHHFGGPPPDPATFDWPRSAAAAIALLEEAYAKWMAGVRTLKPEDLAQPLGPAGRALRRVLFRHPGAAHQPRVLPPWSGSGAAA